MQLLHYLFCLRITDMLCVKFQMGVAHLGKISRRPPPKHPALPRRNPYLWPSESMDLDRQVAATEDEMMLVT
jgi:hypothetical protein